MDFLGTWITITWDMIVRSALFLIIGFFLAGIIRAFITPEYIGKIFGKGWFAQVYKSSLVGIPLPLCSCSVLPVAMQLNRSGLSRAGTVSFLISTPETGVDSIALSYRLLGPIFAIARPVAALMTAIIGGLAVRFFIPPVPGLKQTAPDSSASVENRSFGKRIKDGMTYVRKDMLPELSYYLFWGFALAGLVAALIPGSQPAGNLPVVWQYLGVIAASLPVYVCATSSTPLAAVMLSLGILPGAVLAFLLMGPATNLTSLVVQKRILGLKGTVIMTVAIVMTGIVCGLVFDLLVGGDFLLSFDLSAAEPELWGWYDLMAGALFTLAMIYYTARHYIKKLRKKIG